MKNYIELHCEIHPFQSTADILIGQLAEIGFESFQEEENKILAYIPEELYDENKIAQLPVWEMEGVFLSFEPRLIPATNWNAEWEKNYQPVFIDDRCYIRASFHPEKPEAEYELLIEPRMSFGTAHHDTTRLMIQLMLATNFTGKSLVDMGCGTGILAILARKMGAFPVYAVDNDPNAVQNAKDNAEKNLITDIVIELGDASLLQNRKFDVILANINRNILVQDMPFYAHSLPKEGMIFFSGFYEQDIEIIQQAAKKHDLVLCNSKSSNNWMAAQFIKH